MNGLFPLAGSPAHARPELFLSPPWGIIASLAHVLEWHGWEVVQHVVEILAIVAIAFALVQYRDAKAQSLELSRILGNLSVIVTELSTQTTHLRQVERSMSTRYLGTFPKYLDEITEVVSGAKDSILILCDLPAYGCFSDPPGSTEYAQAIERKINAGVDVRVIFFAAERQKEFLGEFFSVLRIADWERYKYTPENRLRIEQFVERNRQAAGLPHVTLESLTRDDLVTLILAKSAQTFEHKFMPAKESLVTTEEMPVYFWVADNRKAVFTISSRSEGATDYGFRTTSTDLITAFSDMWNVYARKVRPRRA
jgi:hypothetical protein